MIGHRVQLLVALLAYAGLLLVARAVLSSDTLTGPAEVAVALLPVPAAVVLLGIVIREFLARDELEQRIRLAALAVSFCTTLLVTFTWGFLEGVDVEPLGGFVVFAILVGSYLAGLAWASARYQ